jgi:hypothetical protein
LTPVAGQPEVSELNMFVSDVPLTPVRSMEELPVMEPGPPTSACSPLAPGDLGLKVLLCESADGSDGAVSFMPIVAWVTLTDLREDGAPADARWSWEPVVVFEHALRLARTVPHYRGTVAKDVIGKVALGLVKSRFVAARDERRSHSPIWTSTLSGL